MIITVLPKLFAQTSSSQRTSTVIYQDLLTIYCSCNLPHLQFIKNLATFLLWSTPEKLALNSRRLTAPCICYHLQNDSCKDDLHCVAAVARLQLQHL